MLSAESVKFCFLVTFNITLSYIFPENFIEIYQVSQNICIFASSILTIFINLLDFKKANDVSIYKIVSVVFWLRINLNNDISFCLQVQMMLAKISVINYCVPHTHISTRKWRWTTFHLAVVLIPCILMRQWTVLKIEGTRKPIFFHTLALNTKVKLNKNPEKTEAVLEAKENAIKSITTNINEQIKAVSPPSKRVGFLFFNESPLKMIKNAFNFKLFSFSRYSNFCPKFFVDVRNQLDDFKVNFKIYDVIYQRYIRSNETKKFG